jgi:hypothetical protein
LCRHRDAKATVTDIDWENVLKAALKVAENIEGANMSLESIRAALAWCTVINLVFLPSGDAALTRPSRKYSGLSAVVVKW